MIINPKFIDIRKLDEFKKVILFKIIEKYFPKIKKYFSQNFFYFYSKKIFNICLSLS